MSNCKKVWDVIEKIRQQGTDTKELEDVFCDFELGSECQNHIGERIIKTQSDT